MHRETTIKDALYRPFDNVDSRPGRGGTYDYIKWQHVADRMNQVFGTYWTSKVVSENILNNDSDVILRIRVEVSDPETKETFSQEGYGGASVRNGEEVGTAFKSAYSKGIKDACKKWGIGLYLSEDHNETTSTRGYNTGPSTQTPQVQSIPTMPTAPVSNVQPTGYQPKPIEQQVPVQNRAHRPTNPVETVPPIPNNTGFGTSTPVAPVTHISASGVAPVSPIETTQLDPVVNVTADQQMSTNQDNSNTPGTITAVQSLAISNMAKVHGAQTEEDVLSMIINTDAAGLGRQINELKDLSYNEAVKIIRTVKDLQDKDRR